MGSESPFPFRCLVRRPFRGTHYYEWQIGPLVMQVGRRKADNRYTGIIVQPKRATVWLDPYWRTA